MGSDGNRCCSPSEALECLFSVYKHGAMKMGIKIERNYN